MKPEELRYAKTHEWIHLPPGDQVAVVGLSKFAVEALTDLVHIELPEVGREVTAGEPLGEVESVKAVSDLYSPVDGRIVEVNEALVNSLDLLGKDPFGDGWLVKIEVAAPSALDTLLDYAAYQKQVAEESEE